MRTKKLIACLLAAALIFSLTVFASAEGKSTAAAETKTSTETESSTETASSDDASADAEKALTSIFRSASDGAAETKDETVYVMTDTAGSVKQIIVSDWIKNGDGAATLDDKSTLSDIENVKGDETYTMGTDSAMSWAANGSDIYYRGNASADLPVSVAVSYQLDGKDISAADLEGKSGKVTIRFTYTNNEKKSVEIDGKQEDIYVPFLMATGLLLDTDSFTNVEITNGKVLNDSNRIAVMGFALPGMQESLGVEDKDDLLPNTVEITADATDFSLGNTLTLAMPLNLDNVDLSNVDSFEDLQDKIQELVDGSSALVDGTSKLYDGLETLLDKSGELIDGVDQLATGAQTLKAGAQTLSSGMSSLESGAVQLSNGADTLTSGAAQIAAGASTLASKSGDLASGAGTVASGATTLYSGTQTLSAGVGSVASGASKVQSGASDVATGASDLSGGLSKISANSTSLNSGAKQVFQTLIDTANTQLSAQLTGVGMTAPTLTIDNYDATLTDLAAKMDPATVEAAARAKVEQAVRAAVAAAEPQIRAAVEAQIDIFRGKVISAAGLSYDYATLKTMEAAGQIPAGTVAQIDANVSAAMEAQIQTEENAQIAAGIASKESDVQTAVTNAQNGQKAVNALKASLDSYNQFYQGLLQYTAGVDQATSGASKLASGASTLSTGADALQAGTTKLQSGAAAVQSGASQVQGGTAQVSDGASQLAAGASQLSDKMGELAAGASTLSVNLNKLSSAAGQLNAGAAKIASSMETLSSGLDTLKSGSASLVDGVSQLADGAKQVSDGMKKLNDEGIQKIADLFNGDLGTALAHLRALADVAGSYNNYSGISDNMDGTVKFVYKTDSIGDN